MGHLGVGVQLQADRCFENSFRLRITPVDDQRAVDRDADAVALGQDLDVVPVVLLADFFGRAPIYRQTVAAIQVVHAPARGEHDQVALVGVLVAFFGKDLAPEGHARVHLRGHELAAKRQTEVGKLALGHQVGRDLGGILGRVLADDDAVLVRPVFLVPLPAIEVLAVEQAKYFRLAFVRRHQGSSRFGVFGRVLFRVLVLGGLGGRQRAACK
jgi:hypothetical protein